MFLVLKTYTRQFLECRKNKIVLHNQKKYDLGWDKQWAAFIGSGKRQTFTALLTISVLLDKRLQQIAIRAVNRVRPRSINAPTSVAVKSNLKVPIIITPWEFFGLYYGKLCHCLYYNAEGYIKDQRSTINLQCKRSKNVNLCFTENNTLSNFCCNFNQRIKIQKA